MPRIVNTPAMNVVAVVCENDRSDVEHAIDQTLSNGDVVDIDEQDAIVGPTQNAPFDDQSMGGQSVVHRQPLVKHRQHEISEYNELRRHRRQSNQPARRTKRRSCR